VCAARAHARPFADCGAFHSFFEECTAMNAPDPFSESLARAREPFPASAKAWITGSRADLRVPVRDIQLTNGEVVSVYDTSGRTPTRPPPST